MKDNTSHLHIWPVSVCDLICVNVRYPYLRFVYSLSQGYPSAPQLLPSLTLYEFHWPHWVLTLPRVASWLGGNSRHHQTPPSVFQRGDTTGWGTFPLSIFSAGFLKFIQIIMQETALDHISGKYSNISSCVSVLWWIMFPGCRGQSWMFPTIFPHFDQHSLRDTTKRWGSTWERVEPSRELQMLGRVLPWCAWNLSTT